MKGASAKKTKSIITPKGIASYAFVWKAQPSMTAGQEPKFTINLIVSKKADLEPLKRACIAAAEKKFGERAPKLIKLGKLKLPFRDGDEEREDDELYAGKIFFAAKSTEPPGVVDEEGDRITDKFDFYSGCLCRLSVYPYGYDINGNKGVALSLNNIQKLGDGERLSGRGSPEDDFGDGDSEDEDDDRPSKKRATVDEDDEDDELKVVTKRKPKRSHDDDDITE
jgi:hypothetical protein